MKLYLSSAIVETKNLEGVSFVEDSSTRNKKHIGNIECYYEGGLIFTFYSTDMDSDKESVKKYFENLEKQESEK